MLALILATVGLEEVELDKVSCLVPRSDIALIGFWWKVEQKSWKTLPL